MRTYSVSIWDNQNGSHIFGGTVSATSFPSAVRRAMNAFVKDWRSRGGRVKRGTSFTIKITAGGTKED